MADEIDPVDAHRRLRDGEVHVVDCREASEHAANHVPGTILAPMSEIVERIDEIPTDREIVVMCRSGGRSARVAAHLEGDGRFRGVANLSGGILAWAEAGLPYEGEEPS